MLYSDTNISECTLVKKQSPGGLQSGAVRVFTCRRLIAFGLNLSPHSIRNSQTLWDSVLLKERGCRIHRCTGSVTAFCVLYYIHLSRVCYMFTIPVCRKRVLVCFGFLSEIDGVEPLLFYLIYLWFPLSVILIPVINQPLAGGGVHNAGKKCVSVCIPWSVHV